MTTVVAVFADLAMARDAMVRLEALGVPRHRMSLHEQDDRDRLRTGAAQVQGGVPDDSGGFLPWLFGSGDDHGGRDAGRRDGIGEPLGAGGATRTDYADMFRRGHGVLGVGVGIDDVNGAGNAQEGAREVAAVAEILRECGAILVEERAARHWQITRATD
jgi:hypothetical protein